MYKANGRDRKTKDKEVANSLKRVFKCNSCEKAVYVNSVQFGEEPKCPVCDGGMSEVIVKKV